MAKNRADFWPSMAKSGGKCHFNRHLNFGHLWQFALFPPSAQSSKLLLVNIMPPDTQGNDIPLLVRELEQGNRQALSRLLTLAAAGRHSAPLAAALENVPRDSRPVVALTGSGGVGKSSLLGALATYFAERGERVGVLACDPESPVTGGALLGDRCRIMGASASERIFVRSLSTAPGQQGIAQNVGLMLKVMNRFEFDRLFIETVGAGQGDIAVRGAADIVVLVLQPQTGDELQWEKAGILEIADIVVINKSDLSGADQTVAEVTRQLPATSAPGIPIVKTSIARREGIEELCRIIESVSVSRGGSENEKARKHVSR
jgi:LAO/AO transport system ATPase